MSFLKTLVLTNSRDERTDPVLRARTKLVANLREQLRLIDEPSHGRTVGRWLRVDGERRYRERVIPVRPWWRVMLDGRVTLTLRSGIRRVEFERGKSAILIKSQEQLKPTIDGLIEAVMRGELDGLIGVRNTLSLPKKPKASVKGAAV